MTDGVADGVEHRLLHLFRGADELTVWARWRVLLLLLLLVVVVVVVAAECDNGSVADILDV